MARSYYRRRSNRLWLMALLCLGLSLVLDGTAQARAMSFRLLPLSDHRRCGALCASVIVADGEIVNSTPQAFVGFLQRHVGDSRLRMVVFVNSPGGRVVASMQFGELLRRAGALVIVARLFRGPRGQAEVAPGYCYSACVYAFIGGKERVIPPFSVAGFHSMFDYGRRPDPFSLNQHRPKIYGPARLVAALEDYTARMGVSRQVIREAQSVSANAIHVITPAEMRQWRLAARKF